MKCAICGTAEATPRAAMCDPCRAIAANKNKKQAEPPKGMQSLQTLAVKPVKRDYSAKGRDARAKRKERLPVNSFYFPFWDGKLWGTQLVVPAEEDRHASGNLIHEITLLIGRYLAKHPNTFYGVASIDALFRSEEELDDKYRASLKEAKNGA